MRRVEIAAATWGRLRHPSGCVLTRRGRPVAVVRPIPAGMDAETFTLSHDPAFVDGLNRAWLRFQEHGGTPLEEVERELGLAPEPAGSGRGRPGRRVRRRTPRRAASAR